MHRSLILFVLLVTAPGCAVHELRHDQDRIRGALLDLYADQVLDNLVRAVNGLPIIQLDYTNASSNISMQQTANLSNGLQTTTNSVFTIAAKNMLVATHQTVDTAAGTFGANHTNNVALTATPVLTSNALYDAYLTYLGIPGSFEITDARPPCGAAHVCKEHCGRYYWVPTAFKSEFFDLALITTTQRDRLLVSPDKFRVTLLKLDLASAQRTVKSDKTIEWEIDVNIDKAIPNEVSAVDQWLFDADGREPIDGTLRLNLYDPYQFESKMKHYVRIAFQRPDPNAGQTGNNSPQKYYAIDEKGNARVVNEVVAGNGDKTYVMTETPSPSSCGDRLLLGKDIVYLTDKLRVIVNEDLFDRWRNGGLPMEAQVKLSISRPRSPTTSELLDRVRFRVPQIETKPAPAAGDSSGPLPCERKPPP